MMLATKPDHSQRCAVVSVVRLYFSIATYPAWELLYPTIAYCIPKNDMGCAPELITLCASFRCGLMCFFPSLCLHVFFAPFCPVSLFLLIARFISMMQAFSAGCCKSILACSSRLELICAFHLAAIRTFLHGAFLIKVITPRLSHCFVDLRNGIYIKREYRPPYHPASAAGSVPGGAAVPADYASWLPTVWRTRLRCPGFRHLRAYRLAGSIR